MFGLFAAWGIAPVHAAQTVADRIFLNATIWTGGDDPAYAEAIGIAGDRIIAVGKAEEVVRLRDQKTQLIDLQGAFVAPGFIDNHVHFLTGGLALEQVDLRDARTPEEFSRRIVTAAQARPGKWITEGGWDHESWGGALPTRDWIDAQSSSTPVFVNRLDGHMALANSEALRRAGITAATSDPAGGAIVRDANGRPTGILKDAAMDLVTRVIPAPTDEDLDTALARAAEHAVSRGITQVHDMAMGAGDWRSLETYRRALAHDRLPLRVYAFVSLSDHERAKHYVERNGRGSDRLRWGGVKGFVDGSLGSTTAWFHEPYLDAPSTRGLTMVDLDLLRQQIRSAERAKLQVAVHAIGDAANDWLLDVYRDILGGADGKSRRFRIEHAQHLTPTAISRLGSLNVLASMQPYHAIDDGRWAEKRIGSRRLKGTYAFRSLMEAGARVTFGSDWPVAPIDPLLGVYAAVTRRTIDGANPSGWIPAEKISVVQALRAYTSANAYAGFQEAQLGELATGYLADMVVLSRNPIDIDADEIPNIEVLRTVVGGREVFVAPRRRL